jgi:hypothetical protein
VSFAARLRGTRLLVEQTAWLLKVLDACDKALVRLRLLKDPLNDVLEADLVSFRAEIRDRLKSHLGERSVGAVQTSVEPPDEQPRV